MNLSKFSMENEIRLLLSVPQNQTKAIIIFEGQDDIKLFMKLINLNNTYLFESYGGKQSIKDIITNRFLNENRVIGIADRDYETQEIDRLFFCDHCNAEMMIIGNKDFFEYTLFIITNQFLDSEVLRNIVLKKLIFISVIRKLNDKNDWGLTFQNISINGILQKTEYHQLTQTIHVINNKNKSNPIDEKRNKEIKTQIMSLSENDLLELTNGHDFCKALIRELKFKFPKSKKITSISSDELEDYLRTGYQKEHFTNTILYQKIREYQDKYKLNIVY